jgi:hypothetical protein
MTVTRILSASPIPKPDQAPQFRQLSLFRPFSALIRAPGGYSLELHLSLFSIVLYYSKEGAEN